MQLTAIMPVRNEAWIIGLSARAALMWCDSVVILDHASDDETPQILADLKAEFPDRVDLMREDNGRWAEMHHRQKLLERARELGASHIAPVDADEVLAGPILGTIRDRIEALPSGRFLGIGMKNLHRSIQQYRSDNSPFGAQAGTMLAFSDSPALAWQNTNGYEHHHRSPHGSSIADHAGQPGVMHLQFASWRRLIAKHALYKAMERVKYPTKAVHVIESTYNLAPNERGLQTQDVPSDWWAPYSHLMPHLHLDAEPWQEAETRRLVAEYGRQYFDGLDLFGVA